MPFRFGPWELLLYLIITLIIVIPYWRIFSKAGFSGWLSLTMFIPIINLIMLYYLAFVEWPIKRQLNRISEAPAMNLK